jgi:hypothetical protein
MKRRGTEAALGAMNGCALLGLLALAHLTACTEQKATPQDSDTKERESVLPICSLPKISEANDGKRVSIRGRMMVGAHEIFLTDERCPNMQLDLERATSGPDITLCESEELTKEFGCPGGNDNGPIVTTVGILSKSRTPDYAKMVVEEMIDFESAPDARQP